MQSWIFGCCAAVLLGSCVACPSFDKLTDGTYHISSYPPREPDYQLVVSGNATIITETFTRGGHHYENVYRHHSFSDAGL